MPEVDKFEAMEVRTRKQEEEFARMKRNKKRNFIVGLSCTGVAIILLIVIYCLAAFVWLADLTTLPYIEYTYSAHEGTTTATITRLKSDSDYPENFRIPAKVNGLTVTGIGPNAFAGCDRLKSIKMTDNVTWIGDYAFAGNDQLAKFEFSSNINHLGTGVFNDTAYLKNLPKDGVSVVSKILFNVGKNILGDNTILLADHDSIIPDAYKSSEYNVVYISDWAQDIAIGGWGEALFQDNENIVYAEVPDYLDTLPANTFNGCVNLKEVKFSTNVTSIKESAFENTPNLNKIVLGDNVSSIEKNAFKSSGISSINLTDKVENLGEGVFENCKNLTTFDWPDHLDVPNFTFKNCENLNSIDFGEVGFNSITKIGESAFENTGLKEVIIPKNVSTISLSAFDGAKNLETVKMYEGYRGADFIGYPISVGVTAMEPKAFRNTPLKEIILLNDAMVEVSPKNKVTLPNTIESFSTSGNDGLTFAGTINSDNVYSGPVFEEFNFSAFARSSSYQMFKNQINLKKVTFATRHVGNDIDGIKKIGYQSFYGCIGVNELDIPNTVNVIEGGAFANMTNLEKIHLPEENSGLRVINRGLFANASKLANVNINKDIFTFKKGAFVNNYALEYVYIPFDKEARDLSIEVLTFDHARDIKEGETLQDSEKLPIYISFERSELSSRYVKEPVVKDGQVVEEGFYDPLTCKVYYANEWHLNADGVPTPGKAVSE